MQSLVFNLCKLHKHRQVTTRLADVCKAQRRFSSCNYILGRLDHSQRQICKSTCTSKLPVEQLRTAVYPKTLSTSSTLSKQETIKINYVGRDGTKMTVNGVVGDSLLDVAIDNDLEIEGYGACEGTLACSTCHLIFEESQFNSLPEASDEELDMLDFACGLTDTSRLGCQITVTKEMDGMTVTVPEGVADARDV